MKTTIQLKDLTIGKTDAKNELIDNTPEQKELFVKNFLVPDNVNITDFTSGRKFYILGFKGIGKTALLHYIEIMIKSQNPNCASSFVLFKSEIDEDDLKKMGAASNSVVVEKNTNTDNDFPKYLKPWKWFIHRQIAWRAQQELKKGNPIFINDKNWELYNKCVSSLDSHEPKWWQSLFPRVKKGNVKVECKTDFVNASVGLDLEWENKEEGLVKFNNLVDLADELFDKLTPTGSNLYLFIDELELSYTSKRQFIRDVQIIKDLILTVYRFNSNFKRSGLPIKIICAVRSEVRHAIGAYGNEINKPLHDFGVVLKWQQSGGNASDHPLIKMINKRINTSEQALGVPTSSQEQIWDKYFPKYVMNQDTKEYILRRTWLRPRDIIRMLNLAKDQFPEEESFTHQIFDAINKEYSSQSWEEMAEELSANYSSEEIDGIKKC